MDTSLETKGVSRKRNRRHKKKNKGRRRTQELSSRENWTKQQLEYSSGWKVNLVHVEVASTSKCSSDSEEDPFATNATSDEYIPSTSSDDEENNDSTGMFVDHAYTRCKRKLFESDKSTSPVIMPLAPIEVHITENSEQIKEISASNSRSSAQSFHSPDYSDMSSASTQTTEGGGSTVAAYLSVELGTFWVKMITKIIIHQGTYKCNLIPVDNKLTGFIFNTKVADHECHLCDEQIEERCLVVVIREHGKEMQTVNFRYCIPPGELVGEEISVTPELRTAGLRRREQIPQKELSRIKETAGKKHCCVYCKKFYVEISKHLIRIHENEEEVAAIKNMVINSKERNAALKRLRLQGDFNYNKQAAVEDKITYRKLSKSNIASTVACEHCFALLSVKNYARHERKCSGRRPNYKRVTEEARKSAIKTTNLSSVSELTKNVIKELISRINADCILHEIVSDTCLKLATEWYAYMHRCSSTALRNDRQHLRRLARLLLEIKTLEPTILDFEDCILYGTYDILLQAVYNMCSIDYNTGKFEKPALAQVLRSEISLVLKVLQINYKKQNYPPDSFECRQLQNFIEVHDASFGIYVGRCAGRTRLERKARKSNVLPSSADVKLFSQFIIKEAKECYQILKENGFDYCTWLRLGKAELAKLIVFNRRRVSEVASMSLDLFQTRSSLDKQRTKNLTILEQTLATQYKIMTIIGKRHHILHILLNNEQCEHLELFVAYRKEAGVLEDNKYLFGVPTTSRYIDASVVLREFSLECGASQPSLLRTTLLRKQIATMAQLLAMNDNEIKMIAKLMGHSHTVHEQVYRQDEQLFQLTSWAKFLSVASEEDIFKYKGMTLDQLCNVADNLQEKEDDCNGDYLTVEEILGEWDVSERDVLQTDVSDDLGIEPPSQKDLQDFQENVLQDFDLTRDSTTHSQDVSETKSRHENQSSPTLKNHPVETLVDQEVDIREETLNSSISNQASESTTNLQNVEKTMPLTHTKKKKRLSKEFTVKESSLKSATPNKKSSSESQKKASPSKKPSPKKTTAEILNELNGKFRKKKVCFTSAERSILLRHFSQNIKTGTLPSLNKCDEVLQNIPTLKGRRSRDLYNWVQYQRNKYREANRTRC